MMESLPRDSEHAAQLLHPDWALIEGHFGTVVPRVLKDFYAVPEKVLLGNFEIRVRRPVAGSKRAFVAGFTPINRDSIPCFEGFERYLEIASDGSEGLYFIDPKVAESPVWFFDMEEYSLSDTGLRLSGFLGAERLPPRDSDEEEESFGERLGSLLRAAWHRLTKR